MKNDYKADGSQSWSGFERYQEGETERHTVTAKIEFSADEFVKVVEEFIDRLRGIEEAFGHNVNITVKGQEGYLAAQEPVTKEDYDLSTFEIPVEIEYLVAGELFEVGDEVEYRGQKMIVTATRVEDGKQCCILKHVDDYAGVRWISSDELNRKLVRHGEPVTTGPIGGTSKQRQSKFQVGDIVRQNGFSQEMTVREIGKNDAVWCDWFDTSDGYKRQDYFLPGELVLLKNA